MKKTVAAWLFASIGLASVPALASAQQWEKLGSRRVNPRAGKDTIEVTAKEGTFNAIRLDVEGGDIVLYNIKVVFENGEPFSPETRVHFKEGSLSRVIDLPGQARLIRKVEFAYEGIREGKGRAHIHLFGRHAGGGGSAPPRKDPKDRFPGWEHLGSRVVDFGADKDVISCAGEGSFKSFRIYVEEGDVVMFEITVTLGNGDTVQPKAKWEFEGGTRSRDMDLPGKERNIRKIEFKYKSRVKEGKATIHVFGKR